MLFHVTMRHDAANCVGLHPEMMPAAIEAMSNLHDLAAKHGVTVKGHYNGLPNHVEFLVADAPGPAPLAMFLGELIPYETDFETYAVVETTDELIEMVRGMMTEAAG